MATSRKYEMSLISLFEAKTPPILAYHGTSSEFLRSILKHGLDPNRGKGRWSGEVMDDTGMGVHQRSRISYGGIYFSTNFMLAYSSASNTIRHRDGKSRAWPDGVNRLIVCTELQPKTTIPDEDDLKSGLGIVVPRYEFEPVFVKLRALPPEHPEHQAALKQMDGAVSQYLDRHNISISSRSDQARVIGVTRDAIMAEIERILAHDHDVWALRQHYERAIYPERLTDVSQVPMPPDVPTAERAARDTLDKLTYVLRSFVTKRLELRPSATFRITDKAIGFSGSNRIVCIVEINTDDPKDKQLTVHYGDLPDDFRNQYQQSVGELPAIIRKSSASQQSPE